jgi:hypothetical protein
VEPVVEMPVAPDPPEAVSATSDAAVEMEPSAVNEAELAAETPSAPDAIEAAADGSDGLPEQESSPAAPAGADLALPEDEIPLAVTPEPMPDLEPDFEPTTRKRFADRIKRVASDGEAAAPLVPLRSTWKSKSEPETAPEPDPQPMPRATEPARRPRGAPPPVQEEESDVARMQANVAPEPEEAAPVVPTRERTARSVTPRPEPASEAPRTARPQLFGNKRGLDAAEAPLPDLSGLRATPEEIAASAEANGQTAPDQPQETKPAPVLPDDDWEASEAAAEPAPVPAVDPEPPVAVPVAAEERPRLFDRKPRAAPVAPAAPEPAHRAAPVTRLPAPPRMAPPAAATERAAAVRVASEEAQFTPRAIMTRDWRAEQTAPQPRRERTRIAARAVPADVAGASSPAVSATDHNLLDDAIGLIMTRAAELEQDIDPEAKVPVDMILDHARETGEQVMALVSRGQSEAIRRINGDLGGVMDTITLMQLEKGHAPADDALTLILQLKRELETLRAV